jgi:hypothetical protein
MKSLVMVTVDIQVTIWATNSVELSHVSFYKYMNNEISYLNK